MLPDLLKKNTSGYLYHGSVVGGLKVLKPHSHQLFERKVVFASSSLSFALAMIHGTDQQLAVGFRGKKPGLKDMFIDELQPGKLALLNLPGFLYYLPAQSFTRHQKLCMAEYISQLSVPVAASVAIADILSVLKQDKDLAIVAYDQVPAALAASG